jgi:hypothetical protein
MAGSVLVEKISERSTKSHQAARTLFVKFRVTSWIAFTNSQAKVLDVKLGHY